MSPSQREGARSALSLLRPLSALRRIDRHALTRGLIAGLIAGILMACAFPGPGLWPLALVWPIPVIWLATRTTTHLRSTALGVWLGMFPGWAHIQLWVFNVSELGFVPFALYCAIYPALYLLCAAHVHRRFPSLPAGLVAALLWTFTEFFRGEIFGGGYPWYLTSHPLIESAPLTLAGATIGSYGLTALIAGLGGSVVDLTRQRILAGAIALLSCASIWAVASLDPKPQTLRTVRVAIIQTNDEQDNRTPSTPWELIEHMSRLIELTREAASERPDLIVWPESMMPGQSMQPEAIQAEKDERIYYIVKTPTGRETTVNAYEFAETTLWLQQEINIPMLVGSEAYENLRIKVSSETGVEYLADKTFNSVFFLNDGIVQPPRYDKIALTPFGEFMPGIRHWPWLQAKVKALGAHGMSFDLSHGSSLTVFNIPLATPSSTPTTLRAVTPICFEATTTRLVRSLVFAQGARGPERRADIIVNGTNDGWFNAFPRGREQHFQASRWRCLELGTPMARAANTGVSALVDPRGRILARGVRNDPRGIMVDGVLIGELPIVQGTTLYAKGGWRLAWLVAAAGLLLTLSAFVPSKSLRAPNTTPRPKP